MPQGHDFWITEIRRSSVVAHDVFFAPCQSLSALVRILMPDGASR
jgi:hypothetical protein